MEITFPSTFLWGTATAAHQVEGGNVYNDNWVMEHVPGGSYVEPSGDACDHYHRYRDDIALLAELGFTLYRFSVEWSRIEPEEGEFSLAALDHYRRMLAACHCPLLRADDGAPGRSDPAGLHTERGQHRPTHREPDGP